MRHRSSKHRTGSDPDPNSVIKILISTDNHLGYLEKDPVRGDDSFRAFEEVLALAKSNAVDMLLLAGDLFHDNKPSRSTLVRTMRMLRQACMSPDGAVRLAVRSDPSAVNYMNPCVAVSLPVFVIHGNHDDPTGGTGLDALSSLDLLSQAGLVTYFGKMSTNRKIEVAPILLQKGRTSLALYGLGNVRDEVLYNTWMTDRNVRWLSPEQPKDPHANYGDDGGSVPWFNLFVLHQNRYTRGSAKGISDTLLPPWLDYVVWGHEHDSIPDLTLSEPPIVQPGSTVATSLSDGESQPKHAVLLEVYEGKLKHRPVPLHTVRNFQFEDVVLSAQSNLSDTDPKALRKFLEQTVTNMVEEQETLFDNKVAKFQTGSFKQVSNGVKYPPNSFYTERLTGIVRQPLIRLRVETTGNWEPPNPQRFGQAYVGRVACAADVLLFYRNKRRPVKRTRPFLQGHGGEQGPAPQSEANDQEELGLLENGAGEQDAVQIPTLVKYYLYYRQAGGTGLKFLELDKLTNAVDEFVNKSETKAIPDYVRAYLKVQQDKTLDEASGSDKVLSEADMQQRFEKLASIAASKALAEPEDGQVVEPSASKGEEKRKEVVVPRQGDEVTEKGGPEQAGRPTNINEKLDDVHALLSANPRIAAATARVAQTNLEPDDDEGDGDDESFAPAPRQGKGTVKGRGRGRGRGRARAATSSRKTSTETPSRSKPPAAPSRTRRSTRKAEVVIPDSDEDAVADETPRDDVIKVDSEEEYVPVPTTRKRRARSAAAGSRTRSGARARAESQSQSVGARSAFANRARNRRPPSTIDVDEESGDDAM